MRRVLAPLLLLLAAGLVAAGCGSDDGGGGGDSSSSAAPAKTTATADSSSSTSEDSGGGSSTSDDSEGGSSTEVRLQNISFSPRTTKAKVGQEIEWENYDTAAHNVVATGGATFKSETLNKGDKFKFTPTKAGTISYVCTFHPGMQAQITVSQ